MSPAGGSAVTSVALSSSKVLREEDRKRMELGGCSYLPGFPEGQILKLTLQFVGGNTRG